MIGATAMVGSCGPSEMALRVRMYKAVEQVAHCEDLGQVRGAASGWGDKFRADAEDDAKEEAAKRGANALVVTSHSSGFTGHQIVADIYDCRSEKDRLAAAAAAAPPPPAPVRVASLPSPTQLLILEFKSLDGEQRLGRIFTNMLAAELGRIGNLTVVDSSDIEAALDVEKQKDLLGCEETSCLVEIAGAMGAGLVLHGTIGVIGSQYEISASVFDSALSRNRVRVSRMVARNEDNLVGAVPALVAELAGGMSAK